MPAATTAAMRRPRSGQTPTPAPTCRCWPANDTRINAMLMMVDSAKVALGVSRPEDDPGEGPDQPDHRAVPDGLLRMDLYRAEEADKTGSATDAEAPSNQYADGEAASAAAWPQAPTRSTTHWAVPAASRRRKPHGCARRADIAQKTCAAGGKCRVDQTAGQSRRSASSSPRTSTARMRSTAPTSSPRPGPSRARHLREPVAEGNRATWPGARSERRAGQRVRPRQPHADARPRDEGVARRREHGVSHLPEGVPEGALCDLRKRAVAACRVAAATSCSRPTCTATRSRAGRRRRRTCR